MSRQSYSRRLRSGFTLIELLVVIAIIAILAAILFPVFARARENARRAACLSNMKQIGLGILQYNQDYDETMPMLRTYGSVYNVGLPQLIGPYVQKIQNFSAGNGNTIWTCPSDSVNRVSNGGGTGTDKQSYGGVYFFDTTRAPWNGDEDMGGGQFAMKGRSLASFEAPAGTFLFAESHNENGLLGENWAGVRRPFATAANVGHNNAQNCTTGGSPGAACTAIQNPVHMDGWNYLYADGHAKWLRPDRTVGTGVNNSGNDKTGAACTNTRPCGPWTLDAND